MSSPPICLGDTVLLADVGNTRIKLAVLVDHGVMDPEQPTPIQRS